MTKKRIGTPDLAKLVTAKLGTAISVSTTNSVLNAAFEVIAEEFKEGTIVAIKDFGKFELKKREARTGRNPRTGEAIAVPAKTVPKFTFSKLLKGGAE